MVGPGLIATSSSPRAPSQPWLAEIERALATGDRDRAIALAEQSLDAGRRHPLALNLRAFKAEAEGRLEDALGDLHAAAASAPADATLRNAVGLVLTRLGRSRDALAAYAKTTALEPGFAAAWRNLGLTQLQLGDVAGARTSLRRAHELAPADPEPPGQLAVLAARRGDWTEAVRYAEAGLALAPDQPSATRAMVEAEVQADRLEAAAARVTDWLAAHPPPTARRLMTGLLGDVRHRQGRFADAFAAYADASGEARARHAPRFGGDALVSAIERLERAERAIRPRTPAPTPPGERVPERHVFLMGFMRSGTTLLEQALAVRDDVVTLEEQEALTSAVDAFMSDADGAARLAVADDATLQPYRRAYWAAVRGFGVEPAGKTFVDKTPFNGAKLPLIEALFPEAKIVFSIRDPRDVILSCFKHRFSINNYTYQLLDLATATRFYDRYMSFVQTWLGRRPEAPLRGYRHEDLVEAFEPHLRALCDFLRMPWRAEMLDLGARVRAGRVSSPSAVQLRDGLRRTGLQAWRDYRVELAPVQAGLAPWVEAFGYGARPGLAEPWRRFSLTAPATGSEA